MEICLSVLCNFIFLKGSVRHNNYILNCMECERSLFYHDYSCFLLRQSFLSIFLYLRVFRSNTPLNSTFKNHRQYHITDISINSGDIFNLRSYKSILTFFSEIKVVEVLFLIANCRPCWYYLNQNDYLTWSQKAYICPNVDFFGPIFVYDIRKRHM